MTTITHRGLEIKTDEMEVPEATAPLDVLHNYYWVSTKEPHAIRRKAILKAHPEVKRLMGHEPLTKYLASLVVLTQLGIAYYLRRDTSWWTTVFLAYVVGATLTNNMYLAVHEITHNLAFKKPLYNKIFAVFVNTPVPLPYAADFGPYHQLHHKFLGDELYDTDIPTEFEAKFLKGRVGKFFFVLFQALFFALRPIFVVTISLTKFHIANITYQILFDIFWIRYFGFQSFMYLGFSSLLAGSFHPLSGHFIAEHFLFDLEEAWKGGKETYRYTNGQEEQYTESEKKEIANIRPEVEFKREYALETYSYYGILNLFVWNAGLHNEHHDFPFIAWSKLWDLHNMAPEFYKPLPKHDSWCKAIFDFVFRADFNLYSRVKRANPQITKEKGLKKQRELRQREMQRSSQ